MQKARIGGHQVSGGETDSISWHQCLPANFLPASVTQDRSRRSHAGSQVLNRDCRAVCLVKINRHSDCNHAYDDPGIQQLAHESGQDRGNQ